MTPADLSAVVLAAVTACIEDGDFTGTTPGEAVIDRPKNPEHGDYTTNIAMRLAKPAGKPARDVAEAIATRLRAADGIERADVAGPGFLNITLGAGTLGAAAREIVTAGGEYGRSKDLAGQRINLEFVSANPNGPVHLGHTRWAALGDSLHRLLEAAGAEVSAEHYINDFGEQMRKFGDDALRGGARAAGARRRLSR